MNNDQSSPTPNSRKIDNNTSQFNLAHDPFNSNVMQGHRGRNGARAQRVHKTQSYNGPFLDRKDSYNLKNEREFMSKLREMKPEKVTRQKKKEKSVIDEEQNRSAFIKQTLAH